MPIFGDRLRRKSAVPKQAFKPLDYESYKGRHVRKNKEHKNSGDRRSFCFVGSCCRLRLFPYDNQRDRAMPSQRGGRGSLPTSLQALSGPASGVDLTFVINAAAKAASAFLEANRPEVTSYPGDPSIDVPADR